MEHGDRDEPRRPRGRLGMIVIDAVATPVFAWSSIRRRARGQLLFRSHCTRVQILSEPNIHWACVKGKVVDACVPKNFEALISKHGYATSVSHAFIFMHAHLQGYRHVTIIEDDAIFSQYVRDGLIDDVRAVLQGPNDWSFIRLGYRPFFLEAQHKKSTELHLEDPFSCPAPCVCEKFGRSMCRMVEKGCDIRSSHFYIANAGVFESVIADLLDASDEHRIIDWFVLHRYSNQVYATSTVAMQEALDIPRELQEGYAKLFTRLCVT